MFAYFCLILSIFVCCTVGFIVVKSMLSINIHHPSIIINRITHVEKTEIGLILKIHFMMTTKVNAIEIDKAKIMLPIPQNYM